MTPTSSLRSSPAPPIICNRTTTTCSSVFTACRSAICGNPIRPATTALNRPTAAKRPASPTRPAIAHNASPPSAPSWNKRSIPPQKFSVSFQSRLGRDPWLKPYTDRELERLPKSGVKKLLVMCPAFVADCLETLEEIAMRGRETFLEAGGENFHPDPLRQRTSALARRAGKNGAPSLLRSAQSPSAKSNATQWDTRDGMDRAQRNVNF